MGAPTLPIERGQSVAPDESPEQRAGTVHRQKARREHACAECPDPIQPGATYIYLNTFDRGKWSRYVLCSKCERIRSCHRIVEVALGVELSYSAGKLREDVKEFIRFEVKYREAFKDAWAMSEGREADDY